MKLSVILPVYNVAPYLPRAFASLRDQDFTDFEAIFIDDGSRDDSLSVLRQLEQQDRRVKVVTKENGGAASARNLGLSMAQGEFIYFMDPDDWIEKDTFTENIAILDRYDGNAVCFGYFLRDPHCNLIATISHSEFLFLAEGRDVANVFPKLLSRSGITQVWNKIFRRSFLCECNATFPIQKIGEDAIFIFSILGFLTKFVVNPKPYYNYLRARPGGAMQNIGLALQTDEEYNVLLALVKLIEQWRIDDGGSISNYIYYLKKSRYTLIADHCIAKNRRRDFKKYIDQEPFSRFEKHLRNISWTPTTREVFYIFLIRNPMLLYAYRLLRSFLRSP